MHGITTSPSSTTVRPRAELYQVLLARVAGFDVHLSLRSQKIRDVWRAEAEKTLAEFERRVALAELPGVYDSGRPFLEGEARGHVRARAAIPQQGQNTIHSLSPRGRPGCRDMGPQEFD
jgi:hypothetical protein